MSVLLLVLALACWQPRPGQRVTAGWHCPYDGQRGVVLRAEGPAVLVRLEWGQTWLWRAWLRPWTPGPGGDGH